MKEKLNDLIQELQDKQDDNDKSLLGANVTDGRKTLINGHTIGLDYAIEFIKILQRTIED